MVNALLSPNRKERELAFEALTGEETSGSTLLGEAVAHPQLCPRLVMGLQELLVREYNRPKETKPWDDEPDNSPEQKNRQLIFELLDRQSCMDVTAWQWRVCAGYADYTEDVCGKWVAEHVSDEDNEQLLRLAESSFEKNDVRSGFVEVLSKRPLTVEQRLRAVKAVKQIYISKEDLLALVSAEPRISDEELVRLINDNTTIESNKAVLAKALSPECPIEVKWDLFRQLQREPRVRAQLVEDILAHWDAEMEAVFLQECTESRLDPICWSAAKHALAENTTQNRQKFVEIMLTVLFDEQTLGFYIIKYNEITLAVFENLPRETRMLLNAIQRLQQVDFIAYQKSEGLVSQLRDNENKLERINQRNNDDDTNADRRELEERQKRLITKLERVLQPHMDELREYIRQAAAYRSALTDPKLQGLFNKALESRSFELASFLRPMLDEELKHPAQLRRKYGKLLKDPPYLIEQPEEWY
ncbi:MAG TPA: hypothetical protein PKW95_06885 [bacterium]|nr:hypothetical protein [bacterium]